MYLACCRMSDNILLLFMSPVSYWFCALNPPGFIFRLFTSMRGTLKNGQLADLKGPNIQLAISAGGKRCKLQL